MTLASIFEPKITYNHSIQRFYVLISALVLVYKCLFFHMS